MNKTNCRLVLLLISLIELYGCSTNSTIVTNEFQKVQPVASLESASPKESNTCHSICQLPNKIKVKRFSVPVFTGSTVFEFVQIDTIIVESIERSTKWEKIENREECRSKDPEDCMVWCLVEIPTHTKKLAILQDTSETTNFKWLEITNKIIKTNGQTMTYIEELCDSDLTAEITANISKSLFEKGFLEQIDVNSEWNSIKKEALENYQRNHHLPIGAIDHLTIEMLQNK